MNTPKQTARRSLIFTGAGIIAIVLLIALPLILLPNSKFIGADNVGANVIRQLAPQYDSGWVRNWWSPPGTETESLLFAFQATVGGLLIGYAFGFLHGRKSSIPTPSSHEREQQ